MNFIRTIFAVALIAVGGAVTLGGTAAYAGGWTNTGGLAWFK